MAEPNEAERLFTRVFRVITQVGSEVHTIRWVANLSISRATDAVSRDNLRSVRELLASPESDDLFKDKEGFLKYVGGIDGMAATMTEQQLTSFRRTIDAVSLIFVHSALDAAVSDLCRVTALVARQDWEPYVAERKIKLAEVRDGDYSTLLSATIAALIDTLERQSLLMRVDRLFELCKPTKDLKLLNNDYVYDRERLLQLDQLRHNVVHGEGRKQAIQDIDPSIEFLIRTGSYLLSLVNWKYGVRVWPSEFLLPGFSAQASAAT